MGHLGDIADVYAPVPFEYAPVLPRDIVPAIRAAFPVEASGELQYLVKRILLKGAGAVFLIYKAGQIAFQTYIQHILRRDALLCPTVLITLKKSHHLWEVPAVSVSHHGLPAGYHLQPEPGGQRHQLAVNGISIRHRLKHILPPQPRTVIQKGQQIFQNALGSIFFQFRISYGDDIHISARRHIPVQGRNGFFMGGVSVYSHVFFQTYPLLRMLQIITHGRFPHTVCHVHYTHGYNFPAAVPVLYLLQINQSGRLPFLRHKSRFIYPIIIQKQQKPSVRKPGHIRQIPHVHIRVQPVQNLFGSLSLLSVPVYAMSVKYPKRRILPRYSAYPYGRIGYNSLALQSSRFYGLHLIPA